MAFVSMTMMPTRAPARMGSTSSRRRRNSSNRVTSRGRAARLDPIIDDDDVDTTDITTYVSCGKCFNSIMLSPAQFKDNASIHVRCNVCELPATVTLEMLETVTGAPFDAVAWRVRQIANAAIADMESPTVPPHDNTL